MGVFVLSPLSYLDSPFRFKEILGQLVFCKNVILVKLDLCSKLTEYCQDVKHF